MSPPEQPTLSEIKAEKEQSFHVENYQRCNVLPFCAASGFAFHILGMRSTP